jgi:hypothetical protein
MLGSRAMHGVMAGLRGLDAMLPLDSRTGSPPNSPMSNPASNPMGNPMSSRTGDWAARWRGSGLRRRVDMFSG